jgi:plastocyanin
MKFHRFKDEQTVVAALAIVLAVAALWAIGCGGGSGGSYSSSTPTTPSTTTSTTTTSSAGSATVNIVNTNGGNKAFDPNVAQVASGGTIVWKNNTGDVHHLVMNDGSAVIGDIAPGASVNWQLKGSGGEYHCTNHPTMVGSINGASAPPDPMPTPGGGYTY